MAQENLLHSEKVPSTEIRRISSTHFPALYLAFAVDRFKARADASDIDGWSGDDLFRILDAVRDGERDAGWVVYQEKRVGDYLEPPAPVGFCAVIFGASMRLGTLDANIIAAYLEPRVRDLTVAPRMLEAMKAHARAHGARRLLGGSQRPVSGAFRRLGGIVRAVMYEFPLGEEVCDDASARANS